MPLVWTTRFRFLPRCAQMTPNRMGPKTSGATGAWLRSGQVLHLLPLVCLLHDLPFDPALAPGLYCGCGEGDSVNLRGP